MEFKARGTYSKIPATAWKRIILTPPKEVEKYKNQVPEGKVIEVEVKRFITSFPLILMVQYRNKLYWVEKYQEKVELKIYLRSS